MQSKLMIFFSSSSSGESVDSPEPATAASVPEAPPAVIPSQGDLLGDLLNLDLTPPTTTIPAPSSGMQMGAMDLLGGGLDSLVGLSYAFVCVYLSKGWCEASLLIDTEDFLWNLMMRCLKPFLKFISSAFWCFFFLFSFDPCVLSYLCSMLHLQMGDESEPVTTRDRPKYLWTMSGHARGHIQSL